MSSNQRQKIVFVITRSDIGGAQNHVLSLIKAFQGRYDIVLITGSEGVLRGSVEALGIKTYLLKALDSYNAPKAIYGLRKICLIEKPDLVHTHSSLASFFGRAAAKICGLKVLYTVHGWHFASERNPLKWLIKVGLELGARSFTDHWVSVSQFDFKLGVKFSLFKHGRVDVIANGVEDCSATEGDAALRSSEDILNVVFVGRSTYQKNCAAALRVMEQVDKSVCLTMFAAGGQISQLQEMHASCSASSRIKLVLNEPNAARLMSRYSLMLLTSRYEGMPMGVIEAMRAGLAIVSTNVCGMSELVVEGENGYLFDEGDIKGMVDRLNRLAKDREALNRAGVISRRMYEQHFTLDKMLSSMSNVYQQLLDN